MSYKTVETPKGALKYRLPDISEGYEYLALVDGMKNGQDILMTKSRMIRHMEPLIDYSACGYKNYGELLQDKENMGKFIRDIVHEIFVDVTGMFEKKP